MTMQELTWELGTRANINDQLTALEELGFKWRTINTGEIIAWGRIDEGLVTLTLAGQISCDPMALSFD